MAKISHFRIPKVQSIRGLAKIPACRNWWCKDASQRDSKIVSYSYEKLWRIYTMLTELESVFRSLKSEFGLRPVYHSKEVRSDGHLFITVLAYQAVQVLRTKLKAAGITQSWTGLRDTLSVQRRVTATFKQRDGRTLNIRKSTLAEPDLMNIYNALNINPAPGGIKKLTS